MTKDYQSNGASPPSPPHAPTVHIKIMLAAQLHNGFVAIGNGLMMKAGCFTKHQHFGFAGSLTGTGKKNKGRAANN